MTTLDQVRDAFDHEREAQHAWDRYFNRHAYSNFIEINHMRTQAKLTWKELVQNPRCIAEDTKQLTKNAIKIETSKEKDFTWTRAGRCTSFAIMVVRYLERNHPGKYDFRYYDLGGHRLARCEVSGIVIDSSNHNGVVKLNGKQWSKPDSVKQRWRYIDGISKRQQGNDVKASKTQITEVSGMVEDLCEVKDNKHGITPIFLYRNSSEDKVTFGPYIRWELVDHRLVIFRDMSDTTKPSDCVEIVFDGLGTAKSEGKCKGEFSAILKEAEKKFGEQWTEEKAGTSAHYKIWDTATDLWGKPRIIDSNEVSIYRVSQRSLEDTEILRQLDDYLIEDEDDKDSGDGFKFADL